MELWNGFEIKREKFMDRDLIVVIPEKPCGGWVIKTEYFESFPDIQLRLVKEGYYLVHLKNITRWHVWEDTDARAELAKYMAEKYGVRQKCVVIGMSCGGMQGIYFGAKYPEYVSCMYLDAPVVNFLSCPAAFGKATHDHMPVEFAEFINHKGITKSELLSYRDHPLDHLPALAKNNIPIILVNGGADDVVVYEENGKLIEEAYKKNGSIIESYVVDGRGHHPHTLYDDDKIIDFIKKYDK